MGWGPWDCVINTSPTFSALGRRCWGRKTVLSSIFNCSGMRVLGRPPYRNPLKIPIDVYLAPDSVLLPTGSRLNHSACAMVRSWGPPMAAPSASAASPQALLLPVPFTLHPSSLCRVRHLLPNCSSGYGNGSPLSFPYSLLKVNFRPARHRAQG